MRGELVQPYSGKGFVIIFFEPICPQCEIVYNVFYYMIGCVVDLPVKLDIPCIPDFLEDD